MEEIWKPIPFFKGYEVSNKRRVRSLRYKQPLLLKEQVFGVVVMRREMKTYRMSINHLLYGAQQKIDPCLLKNLVIQYDTVKMEFKIYTKDEYIKIQLDKMHREVAINSEDVELHYRNVIRFSESILLAYETDEWSEVINEIVSYKQFALEYMQKARFTFNKDTAEEAWSYVLAECIIRIKSKKGRITFLEGYIKRIIGTYFGTIRAEKKKVMSYDGMDYFRGID
ncbi:NUMOD4 domain-containing protein [Bacteroides sp.]|uniref:NUMOD4 domain-containing protein n=1 Tax=Bacteroides sp. TaxID=29523 RepID=UPI002620FEB7|nr:NUMOD4 domain-containing protein [Bacteroides sp.]